jgi:hypothetical protein
MTYVVYESASAPDMQSGEFTDFEEKVPDRSRRAEISTIFRYGNGFLNPSEVPGTLLVYIAVHKLPLIFKSNSGVHIVQEPLRQLLERMDLGIHHFLPIEVCQFDGTPCPNPCHVLNVHVMQDSIIDEKSDVRRNAGMPDNPNVMYINFPYRGVEVTVDNSRLSGVNLWREKRYPGSLLMSDALHSAIRIKGFKFFDLRKAKEE